MKTTHNSASDLETFGAFRPIVALEVPAFAVGCLFEPTVLPRTQSAGFAQTALFALLLFQLALLFAGNAIVEACELSTKSLLVSTL